MRLMGLPFAFTSSFLAVEFLVPAPVRVAVSKHTFPSQWVHHQVRGVWANGAGVAVGSRFFGQTHPSDGPRRLGRPRPRPPRSVTTGIAVSGRSRRINRPQIMRFREKNVLQIIIPVNTGD